MCLFLDNLKEVYPLNFEENKSRARLANSLKSLLLEKSLQQITVTEICDDSLVSRSNFYKQFNDKYHLLLYVFEKEHILLKSVIDYTADEFLLEQFLFNIKHNFRIFQSVIVENDDDRFRLIFKDTLISDIFDFITIKSKKNTSQQLMTLNAHLIAGGMTELIYWWIMDECSTDIEHIHILLQQLFTIHIE